MAANRRLPVEAEPGEVVPAGPPPRAGKAGRRQPETVWVVSADNPAAGSSLPQVGAAPVGEVCAALGSTLDAGTSLAFTCAGNRCLLSGTAEPVELSHQARYCLGEQHRTCPRWVRQEARQHRPLWDTAEESGEQPAPARPDGWRARLTGWAAWLKSRLRVEEETAGWYPAGAGWMSQEFEDLSDLPGEALNQRQPD